MSECSVDDCARSRPVMRPTVRTERIATTRQDDFLAWLKAAGLDVRHNQMSQGPYTAEFELVTVSPELRFSRSSYGAAITTRGAPPRGTYTFSLPISDPAAVYFNQHRLGRSEIAVVRPGDEFFVSRPPHFQAIVVYADASLVERHSAALRGVSAQALFRGGSPVRADSVALASCIRQFAQVADLAAAGKLRQEGRGDGTHMQGQLLDALLDVIEEPERLRGWSTRRRVLDRAWSIVEDDAGVVTVGELCAKLGVPIRTLDDAFRAGMGISPKRFILGLRLNKAHRRLCRPSERTTVTGVATWLNFFHFGHFSNHYRELFGETPSQTLRHARMDVRCQRQ